MVEQLVSCGSRGDGSESSLLSEWRKVYPKSTLTARALRMKLSNAHKQRQQQQSSEPPPKKKAKLETTTTTPPPAAEPEPESLPPSPPEDVPDEFAPDGNNKDEPATVVEPEKEKEPSSKTAEECDHVMHLFPDGNSDARNCELTAQLLKLREAVVPQFPGCDIYHVKKPRGEPFKKVAGMQIMERN